MNDLEKAQELFKASERELRGLIGMLQVKDMFSDEFFGQHVQQATEKLLKAWIAALGEDFPYTHDLERLLQQLDDLRGDVADYWSLVDFTDFAVRIKYESLLADVEPIEREAVVAQVQSLYDRVKTLLQPSNEGSFTEQELPKN